MIRVLKSWNEIGSAILNFQRMRLPLHMDASKNWDHYELYHLLENINPPSKILDIGCGIGSTLKFLHALGYQNLFGIDRAIDLKLRFWQFGRMLKKWDFKLPCHLKSGDALTSSYKDSRFDLLTCISVIEHGVEPNRFFKEAWRLLKRSGHLFLTTDYWENKICNNDKIRPYGFGWRIFSKSEIADLIKTSENNGFRLATNMAIPPCGEKTIHWNSVEYTFISLELIKS